MPASITHLVVGERILDVYYPHSSEEVQSAFLAGCALVDVHGFNNIERRQTHFVGSVEEEGEKAYLQSCSNFIQRLDSLVRLPWHQLQPVERGFVAGYLCHLAVDECWKKLGAELFLRFGIKSWADFPVSADVNVTTFDFMSGKQFQDLPTLATKLEHLVIPDVFVHVPVPIFIRQWNIIQGYVLNGGTSEAYITMLERAGKSNEEIEDTRRRYQVHWVRCIEFVQSIGGVKPFLQEGIERSKQVLPELLGHSIGT